MGAEQSMGWWGRHGKKSCANRSRATLRVGRLTKNPPRVIYAAHPMKLPPRALLITACAAALGGCASAPPTAQSTPTSMLASQQLRPGMTSSQVELIMGKPQKVRESRHGQFWTYERQIATRVDPVSARVVQEPWIDPITNEMKSIPVPIQGLQRTYWIETVEMEIVDGGVASLERSVTSRRSITD
jgi:outer membrane protein assembly factor BamE (lipoprotein component of BamABCDE complex)